jgi:hypothetical protein
MKMHLNSFSFKNKLEKTKKAYKFALKVLKLQKERFYKNFFFEKK